MYGKYFYFVVYNDNNFLSDNDKLCKGPQLTNEMEVV